MIHYILLPAEERRALRREYRMRLTILTLLFVSTALVFGIIILFPSYIYSLNDEKDGLSHKEALLNSRKASGADQIEKDLLLNQATAQKISGEIQKVNFEDILQKVISYRKKGIILISFKFDRAPGTTTVGTLSMRGTSATRDALLGFKQSLQNDKMFADIDLPLSDLAKSKNIEFGIKLNVKP
jgi:hypothetical protein